jgi:hypothetical protein
MAKPLGVAPLGLDAEGGTDVVETGAVADEEEFDSSERKRKRKNICVEESNKRQNSPRPRAGPSQQVETGAVSPDKIKTLSELFERAVLVIEGYKDAFDELASHFDLSLLYLDIEWREDIRQFVDSAECSPSVKKNLHRLFKILRRKYATGWDKINKRSNRALKVVDAEQLMSIDSISKTAHPPPVTTDVLMEVQRELDTVTKVFLDGCEREHQQLVAAWENLDAERGLDVATLFNETVPDFFAQTRINVQDVDMHDLIKELDSKYAADWKARIEAFRDDWKQLDASIQFF